MDIIFNTTTVRLSLAGRLLILFGGYIEVKVEIKTGVENAKISATSATSKVNHAIITWFRSIRSQNQGELISAPGETKR